MVQTLKSHVLLMPIVDHSGGMDPVMPGLLSEQQRAGRQGEINMHNIKQFERQDARSTIVSIYR